MNPSLVLPNSRIILNYSHLLLPSEFLNNSKLYCDASRLVGKSLLPEHLGIATSKIAWLPEFQSSNPYLITVLCAAACDGNVPDNLRRWKELSGCEIDCYFGLNVVSKIDEIELSAPVEMKSFRLMNFEESAFVDLPDLKFGYDFSNSVLLRLVEDQIGLEEFLQTSFMESLHGFFGEIVNVSHMPKAS